MHATDPRQEYDLASAAAERLRAEGFGGAVAAVQTGSGIPVPALEGARRIEWSDVPGMPRATAPGHRGAFVFGTCRGAPTLVIEGRLHVYEGHAPGAVIRPVRVAGLLGVRRLVLTNATGGVRQDLRAGDLLRVTDHVNLSGCDALTGPHDPRWGDRFVVLAGRTYDARLAATADRAAAALGIPLATGVYGGVHGPTFETPAQVRAFRSMGIDVVGMSTVPEVTAAAQLGMRTLVLSLVANPAGVVADGKTAESEVLEEGHRSGARVTSVVEGVLGAIAQGEDR
ncbi:MAG: Purine nucleoside phosphorylase 1 [Planctomycetes bacterium]|nr:Purine nucleoside phosphorylase 1 [Planctomycetota bacterium]